MKKLAAKEWTTNRLGECCRIVGGATPSREIPAYWNGTIPWLTPKDLSDLKSPVLFETREYISEDGFRSCSTEMLPIGAILFSSRAPIGHVAVAGKPFCTNQGFKSLIPGKEIDSRFLYHTMKQMVPYIQTLGNGATFKEVSKAVMERVEISYPPLAEQKRIADILDEADGLRRKHAEAIQLADALVPSFFYEMFGDLEKNPFEWPIEPVSSFTESFEGGKNIQAEDDSIAGVRYRVLKVSAVTSGKYDSTESKPLPPEYEPPADHFVRRDDLLISRANTTALVGASAYVFDTPDNSVLPDKIWRFVWKEPRTIDPLYVWAMLQNLYVRFQLGQLSTGTSGSMKNISMQKMLSLAVPVPPLHLQTVFADRLRVIRQVLDDQSRSAAELDSLFHSLMQRAFRGEI